MQTCSSMGPMVTVEMYYVMCLSTNTDLSGYPAPIGGRTFHYSDWASALPFPFWNIHFLYLCDPWMVSALWTVQQGDRTRAKPHVYGNEWERAGPIGRQWFCVKKRIPNKHSFWNVGVNWFIIYRKKKRKAKHSQLSRDGKISLSATNSVCVWGSPRRSERSWNSKLIFLSYLTLKTWMKQIRIGNNIRLLASISAETMVALFNIRNCF